MRVLLDEQLPLDLAAAFPGHSVATVVGLGWSGIKNGELLRRMRGDYEALITMDRGIEFQQNIGSLPFGIVLLSRAPIGSCTSSRSCPKFSMPFRDSSRARFNASAIA